MELKENPSNVEIGQTQVPSIERSTERLTPSNDVTEVAVAATSEIKSETPEKTQESLSAAKNAVREITTVAPTPTTSIHDINSIPGEAHFPKYLVNSPHLTAKEFLEITAPSANADHQMN